MGWLYIIFPLNGGVFEPIGENTPPPRGKIFLGGGQTMEINMTLQLLFGIFPLGSTVITPNAQNKLNADDVYLSLRRHSIGDWGDICPEDVAENELSLKEGFRLFSVYSDRIGTKFYIITEADRSVTTILLPEDY